MIVRIVGLISLCAALLYIGTAGWVKLSLIRDEATLVHRASASQPASMPVIYRGVQFRDAETARHAIDDELAQSIWPWMKNVPATASLLLLSLGFGGAGGGSSLVVQYRFSKRRTDFSVGLRAISFGTVLGLMLGLLSFLVPQIFTVQESVILRPESASATCFFGGVFQESTYVWLEKRFKNLLAPSTD